jgi:hypothetical protein
MIVLYTILVLIVGIPFAYVIRSIIQSKREFEKDMEEKRKQKEEADALARAQHLAILGVVKEQAEQVGDTQTVQAVLNMTYDGRMPVLKFDGTYTNLYSQIYEYNIAGINYRSAASINRCVGDFHARLIPEPTNEYDPNAVKIVHEGNIHLGYIPADSTGHLRKHFQLPAYCWGHIDEHEDYDGRKYYTGTVWVETEPSFVPSEEAQKIPETDGLGDSK